MKKLIGTTIKVHFKKGLADLVLEGLLIDIEEGALYLQTQINNGLEVLVVPQENVLYYSTAEQLTAPKSILFDVIHEEPRLKIMINDELAAELVVKNFDLGTWSSELMEVALADGTVKGLLANKKITSVEYTPGELRIHSKQLEGASPVPPGSRDDFAINLGGGPVATAYLEPAQMVTRLNGIFKKG